MNLNLSVTHIVALIMWGTVVVAACTLNTDVTPFLRFLGSLAGGISVGLGIFGAKIMLHSNDDNDDDGDDGDVIHAGDTVALVEAMKTFNPIKSDRDGIIKEILVSDGAAVEFDQPLIVIE